MSALIKKKLLKELTKFTKNLKPEQIELHALRGEGELRDLELDERFLTAVLEFPAWLRLSKCTCDRVRLKVHWAHLGSKPLHVHIDKLVVRMETCEGEEERVKAEIGKLGSGKYGFTDKVIDGMEVTVSSIVINLLSPGFVANVEMSQLQIQSTTPHWVPDRLNKTRIIQENINMVTTFKQVVWQNLKVEFSSAKAAQMDSKVSPLRLITSQGQLHITVRKRLSDCTVECGRLEVILEDYLLWVLTLSQLNEAVLFAQKLSKIIQCAHENAKKYRSVSTVPSSSKDQMPSISGKVESTASPPVHHKSQHLESATYPWFIRETSHHLRLGALHLQLYDDSNSNRTSEDACGSVQLCCNSLFIDLHPRHSTLSRRTHWPTKNRHTAERNAWVQQLLKNQADKINAEYQKRVNWKQLYESSFIIGCGNFSLQYFSSAEGQRNQPPFLSSESIVHPLPTQTSAFQLDYTMYFYQVETPFQVPYPNCHLSVNPVQLTVDTGVCLWLVSFSKSIFDTLETTDLNAQLSARAKQQKKKGSDLPVDVQCDFLLPTITIPVEPSAESGSKLPAAVQVQGAKITATNCSRDGRSQAASEELVANLAEFQERSLFCTEATAQFPSHEDDLQTIPEVVCPDGKQNAMLTRAQSVWSCSIDQCWAQFVPVAKGDGEPVRPEQFLGSVPVNGWIVVPSGREREDGEMNLEADIHAILRIKDIVVTRLNHNEFLFLFALRDLLQQLLADVSKLLYETNSEETNSEGTDNALGAIRVSAAAIVNDIHVTIVPAQDQLLSDLQSQYSVDSRQSPAVEKPTSPTEKKSEKSSTVTPQPTDKSGECEVAEEHDAGVSPQQSSDSGIVSAGGSVLAADFETNSSNNVVCSSGKEPVDSTCTFSTNPNSLLKPVTSSSSLPTISSHIQRSMSASEGDIPTVVVTESQSAEQDIVEDYDVIDVHELGSSTSLSSQGSSMSGEYSEVGQPQGHSTAGLLGDRRSRSDAFLVTQQFSTSVESSSLDFVPSPQDARKYIIETEVAEELKMGDSLSDHVPQDNAIGPDIVYPLLQGDSVERGSVGDAVSVQTADGRSSVSSVQPSHSSVSDEVTVVEVRLKETQVQCQVDGRGVVIKVSTPDLWLKEDRLSSRFIADLEHKRRRRAIESACCPSGDAKAQMKLRFHVLEDATSKDGVDYLASVKVNGMVSELQLPTALSMLDFIDDDAIPVSDVLPLNVEVTKSQFAIRLPDVDTDLAMKYSACGLNYTPIPLKFQVDSVKMRRGTDGIFIIEQIGDQLTNGPVDTANELEALKETKVLLTDGMESRHDVMVDAETMTQMPSSKDTGSDNTEQQYRPKEKTLFELVNDTSKQKTEWITKENTVLKQSVKHLSAELVALKQTAEAAQLGKQELLKSIVSLQDQLSEAEAQKQRLEDEILSLKSILVAQELAADGVTESPQWQRRL